MNCAGGPCTLSAISPDVLAGSLSVLVSCQVYHMSWCSIALSLSLSLSLSLPPSPSLPLSLARSLSSMQYSNLGYKKYVAQKKFLYSRWVTFDISKKKSFPRSPHRIFKVLLLVMSSFVYLSNLYSQSIVVTVVCIIPVLLLFVLYRWPELTRETCPLVPVFWRSVHHCILVSDMFLLTDVYRELMSERYSNLVVSFIHVSRKHLRSSFANITNYLVHRRDGSQRQNKL